MPDILSVLTKWWKMILSLTIVAALAVAIIVLVKPKEYLSTVTAMPGSAVAYDKARIFNENIEGLYSALGHPEDLDKVIATSVLDTLYIKVAEQQKLAGHYRIKSNRSSDYAAALKLKANTKILKSEYGDLKIRVWDRDPLMAAHLANTLFNELQLLHQDLQNQTNTLILENLRKKQKAIQNNLTGSADSLHTSSHQLASVKVQSSAVQLQQYEKLISEYELMINTKPQVLLLVEGARPSLQADRPRLAPALLMVIFASVIFSSLLAYFLESKRIK